MKLDAGLVMLALLALAGCSTSVALRPSQTCDGGNIDKCKESCGRGGPEQGRSCYRLAWFYEEGEGVKRNSNKAVEHYKQACDANWAVACRALGIMYWDGEVVKRSKKTSIQYFTKACQLGIPEACPTPDMLAEAEGRKRKKGAGVSGFDVEVNVEGSAGSGGPDAPSGSDAPSAPDSPSAPSPPSAPAPPPAPTPPGPPI